ncbi:hypothetical protein [Thermovibrio sp.]
MKRALTALTLITLFPLGNALGEGNLKVLTKELSIRGLPNGQIVETVDRGKELPLKELYNFWGLTEKGWVNCDYGELSFPLFKETGELRLKVAEVIEPTGNLKEGDLIVVYKEEKGKVIGLLNGEPVEADKEKLLLKDEKFKILVPNFKVELKDRNGFIAYAQPGEALLKGDLGYAYKGHLYETAEREKEERIVDKEELLRELDRLIDIFNSVKFSSPLSERFGYFVKTLPVKPEDLKLVKTGDGEGVVVKLKYQFITKDGETITDRKTRFFLKKSNFEFWRKITQEMFQNGIDKFVEIDVYRFNGKGGFEYEGFVASSYHIYKEGKLDNYRDFVENSESNLSDDLWFFADQFYERLEGED